MQGISQQTLQSLVDFIYTGRVSLCQENVQVFFVKQNINNISQDILFTGFLSNRISEIYFTGYFDICRHDRTHWCGGKMHILPQVPQNHIFFFIAAFQVSFLPKKLLALFWAILKQLMKSHSVDIVATIMYSFFWRSELHESNAIGIYRFAEGHNIEGLRWFNDNNTDGDGEKKCKIKISTEGSLYTAPPRDF